MVFLNPESTEGKSVFESSVQNKLKTQIFFFFFKLQSIILSSGSPDRQVEKNGGELYFLILLCHHQVFVFVVLISARRDWSAALPYDLKRDKSTFAPWILII